MEPEWGSVASPENTAIVKANVNRAQGFGYETMAESVGDAKVVSALGEFEADYAQGFHFGRPTVLRVS
jgi:EAL domain-containing protein (putative c-di-GMP-specific phosphodiesterase class I)